MKHHVNALYTALFVVGLTICLNYVRFGVNMDAYIQKRPWVTDAAVFLVAFASMEVLDTWSARHFLSKLFYSACVLTVYKVVVKLGGGRAEPTVTAKTSVADYDGKRE